MTRPAYGTVDGTQCQHITSTATGSCFTGVRSYEASSLASSDKRSDATVRNISRRRPLCRTVARRVVGTSASNGVVSQLFARATGTQTPAVAVEEGSVEYTITAEEFTQ